MRRGRNSTMRNNKMSKPHYDRRHEDNQKQDEGSSMKAGGRLTRSSMKTGSGMTKAIKARGARVALVALLVVTTLIVGGVYAYQRCILKNETPFRIYSAAQDTVYNR